MASTVAPLVVGWHAVDIGDPPFSPLYDTPPVVRDTDQAAAHRQWRSRVEADQRRIAAAHGRQPVWYPVPVLGGGGVFPVCGGTSAMWGRLAASVALLSARAGVSRIRLANLTQASVFDDLHRLVLAGAPARLRRDVVSAGGSTLDLFGNTPLDVLAGLVVDVVRTSADAQGRRTATHDKRALIDIGKRLKAPVDLPRLQDAVAIALGDHSPGRGATLSAQERRGLEDHHDYVVARRPQDQARLSDLAHDLDELSGYRHDPAHQPLRVGRAGPAVRTLEAEPGGGTQDYELARELLGRAMARAFAMPSAGAELLLVVGADLLSREVLDFMTASAAMSGKNLVLVFCKITEPAERVLGSGGSGCAAFLRLPNHNDAKVAAEYIGREFTFVVNGFSIADGDTEQWNSSRARSTGTSRGRTTTATGSSGVAGKTLNFGHNFGTTVTESFSSNDTHTTSTGGSRQRTHTTTVGRTHDYVLQPETFQRLDDDLMLVVDHRTAVLVNCDPAILGSPRVSPTPLGP
jgi:hypothetical protein